MIVNMIISLILVGFIAGVLSGLMGVGGGTITIPALVFIMGLSQHSAQGISLAIIIPTAMIGAYGYYLRNNIDLKRAIYLSIGSIFGAYFGSNLACNVSSLYLKRIFGIFVFIIAIKVFIDVFSKKK